MKNTIARIKAHLVQDTRGGAFVEYIVVTALVALAGIGAFQAFGSSVGEKMNDLGGQVTGI